MLETEYNGIYRDDGLLVFDKKILTEEVCDWLQNFQSQVNDLRRSEHLDPQFITYTVKHEIGKIYHLHG